ncbi:hypothetical protein E3P99_03718 [Wallemia hederae]|uniref:Uncharacterized protein n=1 Tax=Wallemia hederae TaxID=1540922 RepID=A0A4T0FDP6_9BASI|nr:hypothetical protein E3P99_03718 [Wallemia hederae]
MKLAALSLIAAATAIPLHSRSDHPFGIALEKLGHDVGDLITDVGDTVLAIGDTLLFNPNDSDDVKISNTYSYANDNLGNGVGELFAALVDMSEGIALGDTSEQRADAVNAKYADANTSIGEALSSILNATQLFANDLDNDTLNLDLFSTEVQQYITDLNNSAGSGVGDLLNTFALAVQHQVYEENGPSEDAVAQSYAKTTSELGDSATDVFQVLQSALESILRQ